MKHEVIHIAMILLILWWIQSKHVISDITESHGVKNLKPEVINVHTQDITRNLNAKTRSTPPKPDIDWSKVLSSPKAAKIEEKHVVLFEESIVILIFIALIITFMVYLHSISPFLELFPESIWAIFIGMTLGFYLLYHLKKDQELSERLEFNSTTFFLGILPPIMFQAGFSLKASAFFRNIGIINSYAIGATIIASFLFAIIMYYGMQGTEYKFNFMETLQFGWLISAIDPVATISIFQSLNVNDAIYLTVFGESTLNDAVAIALSSSVDSVQESFNSGQQPNYFEITLSSITYFLVFFFVSLLIGVIISIFMSYLFVVMKLDLFPWLEVGIFLQCAYLPYIIAEYLGLSGIMSILACGITLRNYAYHSLSPCGKIWIEYLIETFGYICENFVFAYLGISIPLMITYVTPYLILIWVVALLVSRIVSVLIVSIIVNLFTDKKNKVKMSQQLIMIYGGLRGAIAFYLSLKQEGPNRHIIITMTIVLILFTVMGLGSTTSPFLKLLDRWFPEDKIINHEDDENEELLSLGNRRSSVLSRGVITRLESFDARYGQKYLRKDYMVNHADSLSPGEGIDPYYRDEHLESYFNYTEDAPSAVPQYNEVIDRFFNREAKGGDLSILRGSNPVRLKSFRINSQIKFAREHEKSVNLRISSKMIDALDYPIERFEGPAIELPGLEMIKEDNNNEIRSSLTQFVDRQNDLKNNQHHKLSKIISESLEMHEIEEPMNLNPNLYLSTEKRKPEIKTKRASFRTKLSTLMEVNEDNEDEPDQKYNTRGRLNSDIPGGADPHYY